MADDWQVGDLALCVDDTNLRQGLIRKGAIYRVNDLCHGEHVRFGPQIALFFDGVDDIMGHAAIRFRKIRPLTEKEREAFEQDLRIPGHDLPTHTPQAPAREVVALPARSETHTPLQGRAGLSIDLNHFAHEREVI